MGKRSISQSLIKDLIEYNNGNSCGNVLHYKHVEKKGLPSSDVMNQGHYFEFVATGAMPKYGDRPYPEMLKSGKREWSKEELIEFIESGSFPGKIKTPPLGVTDEDTVEGIGDVIKNHKEAVEYHSMTEPYKRAHTQAKLLRELMDRMGMKILSVGETKVRDGLEGTRDLQVKYKGRKITIDLKYSGMINNEFEKLGWGGLKDFNPTKKGHWEQMNNHKIQTLQYSYVFDEPFYYWIFSSATGAEETGDNLLLQMRYSDFEMSQHLLLVDWCRNQIETLIQYGFEPRPEYMRCKSCPLFENCEDRQELPVPVVVNIKSE